MNIKINLYSNGYTCNNSINTTLNYKKRDALLVQMQQKGDTVCFCSKKNTNRTPEISNDENKVDDLFNLCKKMAGNRDYSDREIYSQLTLALSEMDEQQKRDALLYTKKTVEETFLHILVEKRRNHVLNRFLSDKSLKDIHGEMLKKKNFMGNNILETATEIGFPDTVSTILKNCTMNEKKDLLLVIQQDHDYIGTDSFANSVISGEFFKNAEVLYLANELIDINNEDNLTDKSLKLKTQDEAAFYTNPIFEGYDIIQKTVAQEVNYLNKFFSDEKFVLSELTSPLTSRKKKREILEYIDMDGNNILQSFIKNNYHVDKILNILRDKKNKKLLNEMLTYRNFDGETVKDLYGKNYEAFLKYMDISKSS